MRKLIFLCLAVLVFLTGCKADIPGGFAATTTGAVYETTDKNCVDSDGGKVPDTKGTIVWTDEQGEEHEETDKCIKGVLVEYYCKEGKKETISLDCDDCLDGVCGLGMEI